MIILFTAKIVIKFAITSEMKNTYPCHPLEKAINAATRAVIRMEISQHNPIEDSKMAALEQKKIEALIAEAKQYYIEIVTEVLDYDVDYAQMKWNSEWTTFVQMSASATTINGIAYPNLYFPILQADLQVWLDQLLSAIKNQKDNLKLIERQSSSPAEGNRAIMEWLDIQQDIRECVVLCIALRAMNTPNAKLWDESQRIGEFFWQGQMGYDNNEYYK